MNDRDEILKGLYQAVLEGDVDNASELARQSIAAQISPLEAIEQGLTPGIREVGERFSRMELFLPEMMLSADAMEAAVKVLEPHIKGSEGAKKGRVLVGTVKGDIHDIGKNIVITLLKVNNYEVIDLGRDVPPSDFIDKALEQNVKIVGLSALLTTGMPMMREVIQMMKDDGVRARFKVVIGGGPTSQDYADQIGADGYGETAADAVLLCDRLIGFTTN
jgi:corrinoid protein of di/trimethylamine methyltransferase